MGLGFLEVFVVVFIIFLLLGPKRITGLLKSAGRAVTDFTDALGRPKKDGAKKDEELDGESGDEKDSKKLR